MTAFAQYRFARVSDAEAEAAANALVGQPVDSHVSRVYVDHESLVSWRHPKPVVSTEYHTRSRRVVAVGRRFR